MGAAEKIPWQELVILPDECAELWGYSTDYWLRTVACQPGFPARVGAGWRAGDVIDYRNAHPTTGRRGRRRKSGSTAEGSAGRGDQ